MKINELFEAKASQEAQDAYAFLKKLGFKGASSASALEYAAQVKAAEVNVGKAKSIWRGKQGMPEGDFLFVGYGDPQSLRDWSEEEVKKKADVSLQQALDLLVKAGFKHKKSLRKTFG